MNRLIAKLTGHAVSNWRTYLQSCEETIAELQAAGSPVNDFEAELSAARAAFEKSPSPDACRQWVDIEARRDAVFAVQQALRDMIAGRRSALFSTPEARGKMRDALAEIRAGLERRREQTVASDAKKAEETGVEDVSTRTLAAIDRQVETVDDGLRWIEPDPARAASILQTLLAG